MAISGSIATSNGTLRIGGNSMWGEFFQGRIDEIRIYNRALTQAEIQTDMNTPIGGAPPDTTAPVRSNGSPSGTLAAGTTQTTLSLTTNENATCRYATTAGVAYGSMPNTFATTGGTAQSTTVSGLVTGGSYTYFVRCQDTAGNANTNDFTIGFSVGQPPRIRFRPRLQSPHRRTPRRWPALSPLRRMRRTTSGSWAFSSCSTAPASGRKSRARRIRCLGTPRP